MRFINWLIDFVRDDGTDEAPIIVFGVPFMLIMIAAFIISYVRYRMGIPV